MSGFQAPGEAPSVEEPPSRDELIGHFCTKFAMQFVPAGDRESADRYARAAKLYDPSAIRDFYAVRKRIITWMRAYETKRWGKKPVKLIGTIRPIRDSHGRGVASNGHQRRNGHKHTFVPEPRDEPPLARTVEQLARVVDRLVELCVHLMSPPDVEIDARFTKTPIELNSPPRRPAHPPAGGIPRYKARLLQELLDQGTELTQTALAQRVGFFDRKGRPDRNPVRKAIELHKAGWSLVTSHPDFAPAVPDPDMVYWPNPGKAR